MICISFEGHDLVFNGAIPHWAPAMAVGVARMLGFAPGSIFFADVLRRDDLFNANDYLLKRRNKLARLLRAPIQVDDMVLEVENDPKAHVYQKTKRVVLRPGRVVEGERRPATTVPFDAGKYLSPAQIASTTAEAVLERLDDVTRRLEALETTLLLDGPPAPGAAAPDDVAKLKRRNLENEVRLNRLEKHVGLVEAVKLSGDA